MMPLIVNPSINRIPVMLLCALMERGQGNGYGVERDRSKSLFPCVRNQQLKGNTPHKTYIYMLLPSSNNYIT